MRIIIAIFLLMSTIYTSETSNALMDTLGNTIVQPLKTNEYYGYQLFQDYDIREKLAAEAYGQILIDDLKKVPKEEIEANRKVGTILKLKGNLRISWSFDINYNKNIDVIFFPEDNPYINYAVLFAKDFPKTISKDTLIDRSLSAISIPYDINYDFVKKVLSQSALSKAQQEKFFEVRFGSVFVPMEIEFEWYSVSWYYQGIFSKSTSIEKTILFPKYDKYLNGILEGGESLILCLGIIKSYQVLSPNVVIHFSPYVAYWEQEEDENGIYKKISYSEIFTPLPTAALALTQTNIGDYLVNVRDKPDSKEGKIVTQLLSQKFSGNLLLPKFKKLQEENGWGDIVTFGFMDEEMQEHYKTKQAYYKKEKSKLINPLDKYLILVWNIEPNNWAKVWVLKMIRDEDWIMVDGYDSNEKEKRYFRDETENLYSISSLYRFNDNLIVFINGSYSQTFLESPSTLKLYEGYIHCSGLEYYTPFTQNYIKR